MRPIHTIVIHCSATPEGRPVSVETIRKWHRDKGWRDIGYHYVIDLHGRVHPGRPVEQVGAHVGGHNTGTIGVCYVGGVTNDGRLAPKDTRTAAQREALAALVAELAERFPDIRSVKGHRDFPKVAKACPCFDAIPEYQPVIDSVRAGRPAKAEMAAPAVDPIKPAFPPEKDMGGKGLFHQHHQSGDGRQLPDGHIHCTGKPRDLAGRAGHRHLGPVRLVDHPRADAEVAGAGRVTWLLSLGARLKGWALLAGAVAVAIASAYFAGRRSERADARVRAAQDRLAAMKATKGYRQ